MKFLLAAACRCIVVVGFAEKVLQQMAAAVVLVVANRGQDLMVDIVSDELPHYGG